MKKRLSSWRCEQHGFTLIEILLVIAIIVFTYNVALPQLSILTGVETTSKIDRLIGHIRSAYDLAALSGNNYRFVFELTSGRYWLEASDRKTVLLGFEDLDPDLTSAEETANLIRFDQDFTDYQALAGDSYKDPITGKVIPPVSPVLLARDRLSPPKWTTLDSPEWQNLTIGPSLIFADIQVSHDLTEQSAEQFGKSVRVFMYVFPGGLVEKAVFHIAFRKGDSQIDPGKLPYTLIVDSYTGTTETLSGYQEIDVHASDEAKAEF
jgi:general secretion pathway protein H